VLWVGGGIGVYGLSSFAFLAVAGQVMGQGHTYTALALMWTLLNAIGIGLYLPVEQETGRSIAARSSLGHPTAPAVVGPARYAALSLLVVAVIAVLGRDQITDLMFEGQSGITTVFVLALVGMALAYLVRGILAGTGRFPRYGLQLAMDGALRVVGAGLLAAQGNADPVVYGGVLALAPALASGLAMIRTGPVLCRHPHRTARAPVQLAPLVIASLASQALANAGPVAVQLLKAHEDDASAGNLVNALTIARIPLFLFAAVQAVFLPTLAQHVAVGGRERYTRSLRTASWLTAAVGALGVFATWAVGPEAVRLLFGPTFEIARGDIVLLALSAALFMNVQVIVQGLLAQSLDSAATTVWLVGLASMVAALAVPLALTTRVSAALVVGSVGALATASLALRRTLARWSREAPHDTGQA
jgi:O-antigen/teichoic acid export membrane protein